MDNLKDLHTIMLSAEPMLNEFERQGGQEYFRLDEYQRRTLSRIRRRGTASLEFIDRFCVKILRINPALLYGAEWWEVNDTISDHRMKTRMRDAERRTEQRAS